MATKDARGTKRTCQNDDCGERFYDLNKDPMTCPICGSVYEIAHAPQGVVVEEKKEEEKAKPKIEAVSGDSDAPEDHVDDEADELADIETDDSIDDDDTFLEEEEQDAGDVSTIIKPARDDEADT